MPSYLLLETGDRLLLETGDGLLLEDGAAPQPEPPAAETAVLDSHAGAPLIAQDFLGAYVPPPLRHTATATFRARVSFLVEAPRITSAPLIEARAVLPRPSLRISAPRQRHALAEQRVRMKFVPRVSGAHVRAGNDDAEIALLLSLFRQ